MNSLLLRIVDFLDEDRETNIIIESCTILSSLADGCPRTAQALLDLGTKRRLMQLLTHENETVVVSALRTCRYLVRPMDVTASREVPVSPIRLSPSHRACTQKLSRDEWKICPLIPSMLISEYSQGMTDVDILVCQNVEMFRASEEDVTARQTEAAGAFIVGQVGLRCVHCRLTPFTKAQFSTVFPGKRQSAT